MEISSNHYDRQARKPPTEINSYRPISLLPILFKVFERLLHTRLEETTPIDYIIPTHQFGFRANHSTIQHCHRIVNKIKESIEGKKECTSVFLDIQQAFTAFGIKAYYTNLKRTYLTSCISF
jgi:hypothetical protein